MAGGSHQDIHRACPSHLFQLCPALSSGQPLSSIHALETTSTFSWPQLGPQANSVSHPILRSSREKELLHSGQWHSVIECAVSPTIRGKKRKIILIRKGRNTNYWTVVIYACTWWDQHKSSWLCMRRSHWLTRVDTYDSCLVYPEPRQSVNSKGTNIHQINDLAA